MQQSWRWVSGLVLGLVVLLFSVYQWGLPALAKGVLQITPYVIDERIGALALAQLEAGFVQASELAPAQQETIRQAFGQALSAQDPTDLPPWRLEFRKCAIGPNAFALPGGTLVMTDDMVELVEGDTRVLVAVLGHELGHLRHRHGMRMLVQASALGTIASVLWGDFSWVLATVPTWLAQADYSRQAEREADAYALDVLNAAGISPSAMLTLFNKLKAKREADSVPTREAGTQEDGRDVDRWLGIAFSTHPEDAERIAFFQAGLRK
jgi:Zn-dependent protease with chaperone function